MSAIASANKVWKSLGRRPVLRGADLAIGAGERVAVLGDNGSGKSTLLRILAGVLDADHGTVEVRGAVGFAPEKPDLPEHLFVGEWLEIVASLKGLADAQLPPGLDLGIEDLRGKRNDALSLGQRQRVSLASAWLGDPDVLVLDEPTNALDAASRDEVLAALGGRTVVFATHDREVAERAATRLVTVRDGKVG